MRRIDVAGIPVFLAEASPPFVTSILFRVGRADERATTSGLTHLVEHLAMPARSRRRIDFNGSVDNILTSFWASGSREEAQMFLETTVRGLSALPLERLETERQILLAEEATQGSNLVGLAFALRYGPVGQGLTGYEEFGLRRVSGQEVTAWAAERFTRGNAAVWLTAPDPDALQLDLPGGERRRPPEPRPIRQVAESWPSLYREGPPGAIAFSFEAKRTIAFRVGLNILSHRIQDRLRFELGLTYEVETIFAPLTADRVHVVIVSDATEQNARRVSVEMMGALETMASEGPTAEELEDELFDTRRYHSDPSEVPSQLFYRAAQHLLGAADESARALLDEQERLKPDDVAQAIQEARQTLIAIVPEGNTDLLRLAPYPMSSPSSVEGRRFRPRGLRLRRSASEPSIIVGRSGVTFSFEDLRSTVAFDECAVAMLYPDGSRTLLSESGFFVNVDPRAWKDGGEAVSAIDAAVAKDLVVRMEPALSERSDALEQIASEKLTRRWVVGEELRLLPERLEHQEEIVSLCEAMKGLRAGLLVATSLRVIFFARFRGETWLEFAYDTITHVEGKKSLIDSTITLEARGERFTFNGIAPRERATELASEIESRRNARRSTPAG